MRSIISPFLWLFAVVAVVAVSSCAVTTRSTQGTSETFQNTSEVSTDFTSSTSPRSSDKSESDEAKKQALEFTKVNYERVRTDMAVGGGEHLTSLATLLGISDSCKAEFFSLTKNRFSTLFISDQIAPEELLAELDLELSASPHLKD